MACLLDQDYMYWPGKASGDGAESAVLKYLEVQTSEIDVLLVEAEALEPLYL
jgi:hypothetical protein